MRATSSLRDVIPAQAGIRPGLPLGTSGRLGWIPACAGMTNWEKPRRIQTEALVLAVLVGTMPVSGANAAVKGTFIGPGTYATDEGCQKLAVLAAGGDRNVGTVPETLTEDGFMSWEGGCTFTSFTEKEKGRIWTANLKCFEGADESKESDVFERLDDGKIKMTVMGNAIVLQRCDADKGK